MAHVAPRKVEAVKALVQDFERSPVIGIVNIRGIPAPQLQAMRKQLLGRAALRVSKNNLLRIALKEAASKKRGIDGLVDVIQDQTAVVTAEINPFRLYKEMEATKTKAPARGGERAPEDIWVLEDDTPFKPPLPTAFRRALAVALESGFPTKESVKILLAKAQAQAVALASRAPGAVDDETRKKLGGGPPAKPAKPAKEEAEKAEKKEETPSEEEAAAGLGSLFG